MNTEVWVDCNVHVESLACPETALSRARDASVCCVATGVSPDQWAVLAEARGVHRAYGLHPLSAVVPDEWLSTLEQYLTAEPFAAIGEIGLDFRAGSPEVSGQIERCLQQLELAVRLDRPVILHAVKAHHVLYPLLKEMGIHRFMVHAFNGSADVAERYLDLGGWLSLGGMATWQPAPKGLSVFAQMPMDRVLLETDAPDLPIQGKHAGEPSDLPQIGQALAALRGLSVQAVARQTRQNAEALFGVDFAL